MKLKKNNGFKHGKKSINDFFEILSKNKTTFSFLETQQKIEKRKSRKVISRKVTMKNRKTENIDQTRKNDDARRKNTRDLTQITGGFKK